MEKYFLVSVIVAAVALPALFAGDPQPRRGLRRAFTAVVVFNVMYLFAVVLVHSRPPS